MSEQTVVSYREFARRVGCTDTAIRKRVYHEINNPDGILRHSLTRNASGKQPALIYEIAIQEWVANGGKMPDNDQEETYAEEQEQQTLTERQRRENDEPDYTASITKARAAKLFAEAKMKTMQMELLQGKLVYKDKVYKAFFEYASIMRNDLMNIADQVITPVINAVKTGDEKGAHTLIYEAIASVLTRLSAPPDEKKLNEDYELRDDAA